MATQSDLDHINAQLAAAERATRHGDRSVEYRSVAELKEQKRLIESQLAAAAGTRPIRRYLINPVKDW